MKKCTSCNKRVYGNKYPEIVFSDKSHIICEDCSIDYEEINGKIQLRDIRYVLIDVYGDKVVCNEEYTNLNEAKEDLNVEFNDFTYENNIEYGEHCLINDDNMYAWARLNGKYRIWTIAKVLP